MFLTRTPYMCVQIKDDKFTGTVITVVFITVKLEEKKKKNKQSCHIQSFFTLTPKRQRRQLLLLNIS